MYQAIGKLKETISILHCSSNIHKDQSCQLKELKFFFLSKRAQKERNREIRETYYSSCGAEIGSNRIATSFFRIMPRTHGPLNWLPSMWTGWAICHWKSLSSSSI